jgi:hypothetical protein
VLTFPKEDIWRCSLSQAIFKPNGSSDKRVYTQNSSQTLGRRLANILEPKCDQVTGSASQIAGKNFQRMTLASGNYQP